MASSSTFTDLCDERRSRRSDNPLIATRYQLAQVMDDFDLSACVIATEDGRLFAAPPSMSSHDASLLAAIATEALRDRWSLAVYEALRGCERDLQRHELQAQEFWAWDQPLVMLTVGPDAESHEISLYRAILGIRRIARQTSHDLAA